eukprot:SAG31_NODE_1196_length_9445_cov_9.153970_11_plen_434_part_00
MEVETQMVTLRALAEERAITVSTDSAKSRLECSKMKFDCLAMCRYCLATTPGLEVCAQTSCPWGKRYVACADCRAQHWLHTDECDACFTQRVVTQRYEAAVAGPGLALQHLAPAVRVKDVVAALESNSHLTIYVAKRLLDYKVATTLKGLWVPAGNGSWRVPLNAIVLDEETGAFVCARVCKKIPVSLRKLKDAAALEGTKASKPCGAKGGLLDVNALLSDPYCELDGVATLASVVLRPPGKVATSNANFWNASASCKRLFSCIIVCSWGAVSLTRVMLPTADVSCDTDEQAEYGQWSNTLPSTFVDGSTSESVRQLLDEATKLRNNVFAAFGQTPPTRPLRGFGLVSNPTALHRDCERSEKMDIGCVSVLWAVGSERAHYIPEWGLQVDAGQETAVLEMPKANLHGTEPATDTPWGRTAIGVFEAWRTSKKV